jgi:hypothetical protein
VETNTVTRRVTRFAGEIPPSVSLAYDYYLKPNSIEREIRESEAIQEAVAKYGPRPVGEYSPELLIGAMGGTLTAFCNISMALKMLDEVRKEIVEPYDSPEYRYNFVFNNLTQMLQRAADEIAPLVDISERGQTLLAYEAEWQAEADDNG